MKTLRSASFLAPALCVLVLSAAAPAAADLRGDFREPPAEFKAMPLWHLNGTLTPEGIAEQMRASRDVSGFGGVTVLPVHETRPAYLSDEYFARYGEILKAARESGMRVVFYDDTGFPSGSAGGQLQRLFPNDVRKRLDKAEQEVTGPAAYARDLPPGVLMAAVAMNTQTLERVNLAASVADGKLAWAVPAGRWKIMVFSCVNVGNLVDYLCPESVDKFLTLTYDEYYKRFAPDFGKTIRMTFYDDVGFYAFPRPWTGAYNEKFRKANGSDPATLYPALWYDIGPETVAARVALFGFRAELMAEGYPRRAGDWARAHGIESSGHPPGNYDPCPVDMSCDIFKFYRHSDIPLMDAIFYHGHGRNGFKLVSSAADVYDRPRVAAEECGAYAEADFDAAKLYRTAMETFERGANVVLPHGMWYDPQHVRIPPLISHFSDKLRPALPDYNRWVGRCCRLLQGGRHVTEIALFYPIAALEAWHRFDAPENKHFGQFVPPESDYLAVSDALTCQVRRDFTFLHPDTLARQCVPDGATLRLTNAVNRQDYRVMIVPGEAVIPWESLRRIKDFYDRGGQVVATTRLPDRSAEPGHDADVAAAVKEMFGAAPAAGSSRVSPPFHVRIEVAGSTIKTYVGGTLVDTTVDDTFAQGGVGFRESDDERAEFAHAAVRSPEGKVLLRDDFDGGLDRWQNTSNAVVRGGLLALHDNQTFRSKDGADWRDYSFDVDLQADDTRVGLVFRARDDRNCYMWQVSPDTRQLHPHKRVNGGWHSIKNIKLEETVDTAVRPFQSHTNAAGGRAWFAPQPTAGTLAAILAEAMPVPDVAFEPNQPVGGKGVLSYLHKQNEGRDLYFFANSSDQTVDVFVRLRGKLAPEAWDPHTGAMSPAEDVSHLDDHGEPVTRVRLRLAPVKSLFLVGGVGQQGGAAVNGG